MPSSTLSHIAKVINATLFNAISSQTPRSILNLSGAYQTDPDTSSIFLHIPPNQNKWTTSDLATIHTGYRTALKEHIIQIIKKNGSPQTYFG